MPITINDLHNAFLAGSTDKLSSLCGYVSAELSDDRSVRVYSAFAKCGETLRLYKKNADELLIKFNKNAAHSFFSKLLMGKNEFYNNAIHETYYADMDKAVDALKESLMLLSDEDPLRSQISAAAVRLLMEPTEKEKPDIIALSALMTTTMIRMPEVIEQAKLSAIKANGSVIDLYFTDVKADGVEANTPYLVYYTGETKSIKVVANETQIHADDAFVAGQYDGKVNVGFHGAAKHIEPNAEFNMYGIYVKDNAEAAFTQVTPETSGFYATRCYITVEGVSNPTFRAHHNVEPATAINTVKAEIANGEVFNLNGVRQNGIQKGVNVVDGQKVIVK